MIVVGIDPGRRCGVAIVSGRKLLKAHTANGDNLRSVLAIVQQICKVGDQEGGVVVVIELQFSGRGGKVNPKSLGTLMYRRHLWEILCQLYEVKTAQVWPASWQSQLKIARRLGPKGGKRTTKERSLEVARFYFGKALIRDAEQADAALIARWYTEQPEVRGQLGLGV